MTSSDQLDHEDSAQARPSQDGASANARTRQVLAAKLQLTSLALNCTTHKEICARFSAANALTAFTPQNAYKWFAGKALPRLSSVYSDWAVVLGGHLTPTFIAASSFIEFAEALSRSHALPEGAIGRLSPDGPPPEMPEMADEPGTRAPLPAEHKSQWKADRVLAGRYLAISPAWSPLEMGQLVVGHVEIGPLDRHRSKFTYREDLFGRAFVLSGEMVTDARYAQAILHADFARRVWVLNLHLPPFPASLLTGLLSGSAVLDFDGRLLTGRMMLIRDYNDNAIGTLPTYAAPDPELIDAWLARLGYREGKERLTFAKNAIDFTLGTCDGTLIDVPPEDQRALGLALDKLAPLEGRQRSASDIKIYSASAKVI
ncbi:MULTISPECIES: hypothetical protein [unclassified Chelatococcus]|uniref:hypothetical protein n=1 Tax=unclassified Chelatococcus TaxID=2638111 RepID=UPI001BD1B0DA|nr:MULTISPECIES: hypothetical protein [unclassified Chelatococcus]CAH1673461.1 conserved hypothetical protein [Hyphomicrobiales bacterium]MBS7738820.1 hypothetical protein [Chelatococcus sp. HY11]MBX3547279.1 hypothetical protein [Chelatococcus sp.]MCO5076649.1 hypothetical protein [Chelatococcus sp.]CAH1674284.1 conserved hypothetical protein [Hyphomicrobiales bacterium]